MAAIRRDRPDLVMCGMKLQEGSGYGIVERLRINKETAMVPILAMSGSSEDEEKLEKRKGEQALVSIVKPVDPGVLLAPVRSLLKCEP
jgi:DNA-binding response OmpR family regulator